MINHFLFACVFATISPDLRPMPFEADLFPLALVNDYRGFNISYKYRLEQQQLLYKDLDPRWWDIQEAIKETDWLYKCWDTLDNINRSTTYWMIDYKRDQLSKLRDLIGPEAFYTHQMPPPVPIWHFREIEW